MREYRKQEAHQLVKLGKTLCHSTRKFCNRLEAARDVISGKFLRQSNVDKDVKLCDPQLNHSQEIRPIATRDAFSVFLCDNVRSEVASDVTSGVVVDWVVPDVCVKLGDTSSNHS